MSAGQEAASFAARLRQHELLGPALLVVLGNVLISVIIWLAVPGYGAYGWLSVLVHSQAIGLSAWLMLGVAGPRLGLYALQPRIVIVFIVLLAGMLAFFVGSVLAHLLLGLPLAGLMNTLHVESMSTTLVITTVVTVLFTGYFVGRAYFDELRVRAADEARRAESARLAMLRAQVEPHMLFNTLSTLRALIPLDASRAVEMLDHLNAFLRATLDGSRSNEGRLADEFELLGHYLELMRVRMGDRLRTELDLPRSLGDQSVPTLLLQPLVENAIRHGLEPSLDGGTITVVARAAADRVEIDVIDDGLGMADSARAEAGFGLASVRERLAARHGPKAALEVRSPRPDGRRGTWIRLTMPRIRHHEEPDDERQTAQRPDCR